MTQVYCICMVVGLVVPLLTLLFDSVDNLLGAFDFDLGFDVGDTSIAILPSSIQSLCTGALVFGGLGFFFTKSLNMGLIKANVIAGVSAYICAILVQMLIQNLKRQDRSTIYEKKELLLNDGVVTNKIPKGGIGSVTISIQDSSNVSYPAKSCDGEEILQDTVVELVDMDDDFVIVRDKNYRSKRYDEK